jgi:hypothetical protein
MEKYELISKLEVNPKKALKEIDDFLTNFNEWDEYKDEYIGNEKITILENKEFWNKEYLDSHISLLFSNFSKERLEHINDIIKYLYSDYEDTKNMEMSSYAEHSKKKLLILILLIIAIIYIQKKWNHESKDLNTTKTESQKNIIKNIDKNKTQEKNLTKKMKNDLNTTKEK